MKLNIVTVVYDDEMYRIVLDSIPKHEDITTHIIQSRRNYVMSQLQDSVNEFFETIKNKNQYFMFVDNDTIFHPNAMNVFIKYRGKMKLIIGGQTLINGAHRLSSSFPELGKIDTGNVICHIDALKEIKWADHEFGARDFLFWEKCYGLFKNENTILVDEPISYYNAQTIKTNGTSNSNDAKRLE